jgi:hypothetical protein
MSSVIRIDHNEDGKYQLIFDRPALRMADQFISEQFGDGGAGYFEWDLARLDEASQKDTDFTMTYSSFNELREAIHNVETRNLAEMLEDVMSDFLAHNPQLRPR